MNESGTNTKIITIEIFIIVMFLELLMMLIIVK